MINWFPNELKEKVSAVFSVLPKSTFNNYPRYYKEYARLMKD